MIWTKTKPTKAGWWWYRHKDHFDGHSGGHSPREQVAFVHVGYPENTLWFFTTHGYINSVKSADGEWSSEPIEPPRKV